MNLRSRRQDVKSTSNAQVKIEPEQQFLIVLPLKYKKSTPTLVKNEPKQQNQSTSKTSKLPEKLTLIKKPAKKIFKCKECAKIFPNNYSLDRHGCVKKCKICGLESASASANTLHLKYYHPDELNFFKYECDFCGRKYKNRESIRLHLKFKHTEGILEEYKCNIDGKVFFSINELKTHMKSHITDCIECKICGKKIKEYNLNKHMRNMHPENPQNLEFRCDSCPKVFKKINLLRHHKKIHIKKYECKICKEKLALRSYIKLHEIAHAREKWTNFVCKICKLNFPSVGLLNCHRLTHGSKDKAFSCPSCDYSTHSSNALKKHQEMHKLKEERNAKLKNPLKCEKCSALLRNKLALKCHMMNVHPLAPYECDLCGRLINAKTNVTKHLNLHLKWADGK